MRTNVTLTRTRLFRAGFTASPWHLVITNFSDSKRHEMTSGKDLYLNFKPLPLPTRPPPLPTPLLAHSAAPSVD